MPRYTVQSIGPNTYRVNDAFGRQAKVTGPTAPTERDLDDLFVRMFPPPATLPGAKERGIAEKAWDMAGTGLEVIGRPDEALMGTLTGIVSGLRRGEKLGTALREGLQRGGRAFTENVPQGQITESGAQLLREAGVPTKRATLPWGTELPLDVIDTAKLGGALGAGAALATGAAAVVAPAATGALGLISSGLGGVPVAAAGLGLDFLLSPYNLLGPVGPVRTGAAKALRAVGVGTKAADVLSLSLSLIHI